MLYTGDVKARLFAKRTIVAGPEPTPCWLWTRGVINSNGYGIIKVSRKNQKVHRAAYVLFKGPVPPGLELDHLCGVRSCFNPAHLEATTHRINISRGQNANARKRHCPYGHPYDKVNTLWRVSRTKQVRRGCRICWREMTRKSLRKKLK